MAENQVREKMQELIDRLNTASEAYYGGKDEIMSNYEWDAMYDELARLEAESGIVLPGSPTQSVSSASEDNIEGAKEAHEYPALSLAKTKQIQDLQEWAGSRPVWLSWKLDGLTLVLTYDGGKLVKILTRGDGSIGTNITFMKEAIKGFPLSIPYPGHLVVRGEATISYPDFNEINEAITNEDDRFANPRNLASGTLALDAKNIDVVKARRVTFNAFTLVYTDDDILSWGDRMAFLESLGFTVVDRERTDAQSLPAVVQKWTQRVEAGEMQIPVDGLVICYDDTAYAATGSVTGHHATRAGFAFKWQDQSALTVLRHIEWSCGATTITPVAIFDPVQLEGTTVSRASLVNLSELDRLGIGAVDTTELEVIKANKIIPKVVSVPKSIGKYVVPDTCSACGMPTRIAVSESGAKSLKCDNPACAAKNLKKFERFVSKHGMDIDGLSTESLRDFISEGFIRTYADIFRLAKHADAIQTMVGFGKKSCDKLMAAIEHASVNVDPVRFLTALCIPQIGADAAKRLINACGWSVFLDRIDIGYGFADVDGIGEERSKSICDWFDDGANRAVFNDLLSVLDIVNVWAKLGNSGKCAGLTFVITGDVHTFKNRDAFKEYVEAQGGKVAGSVSSKTNFLVNNDVLSQSSKNRKAQQLGVPIISEDEFVSRFGN